MTGAERRVRACRNAEVERMVDLGWSRERAERRARVSSAEHSRRDGECSCWDYENEDAPCECPAWGGP